MIKNKKYNIIKKLKYYLLCASQIRPSWHVRMKYKIYIPQSPEVKMGKEKLFLNIKKNLSLSNVGLKIIIIFLENFGGNEIF